MKRVNFFSMSALAPASLPLALLLVIAGCTKQPPAVPVPPPQAASWIHEDDTSPPRQPHIEITNLEEDVSEDASMVTVTGTLTNRGEAPTGALSVQVNGLSEDGAVVVSAKARPTSEQVPVNGVAQFIAVLANRPEVRHYHVEAIAR